MFDAIVIGSGISGGWAAKELAERGLKTLVLERGRNVEHRKDYVTEYDAPWDSPYAGRVPKEDLQRDWPVQRQCHALNDATKHFFTKDSEHEYVQEKPFTWIRGFQLGGKSLLWTRHTYRWGPQDFEANKLDGHGCDWPIRYRDIERWYDHVELFAGIAGNRDGIWHIPDGKFQPPVGWTPVEQQVKERVEAAFPGRYFIQARIANLTEPTEEQLALGRAQCQNRNRCSRGCSFGAYFSSQSATLPAAERTGNLTLLTDSVVHSIVYDPATGRASGVRVIDAKTRAGREISARMIFVCASTLATTQILLNSVSERFPNGIGNTSGVLGHYLMDHVWGGGASAAVDGFDDRFFIGHRPGPTVYVTRFRNLEGDRQPFLRGYGYQGRAARDGWQSVAQGPGIGADLKRRVRRPGGWNFSIGGIGEMLPRYQNRVTLDPARRDAYGIPLLRVRCEYGENERMMVKDMGLAAGEMLHAAGLRDVEAYASDELDPPGIVIHEAGTARMGRDPRDSYLNGFNQSHEVPNLFVTDGAALASNACVNPSLTFMALTARAADYAAAEFKAGRI